MDFYIHIFPIAGQPYAERSGEGHDLMRAEAPGIHHIDLRPAYGFLKEAHDIQMSGIADRAIFSELNTESHKNASFPGVFLPVAGCLAA